MNLMSAYVDGELPGTDMLAIRRHLSECAECAQEHESMCLLKQAISRLRTAVPRKDFAAAIMSRLEDQQVSAYHRLAAWATRFAHARLSPVAAALAVSGAALVLMTAGSVPGLSPKDFQNPMAAFGPGIHETAFLSEISKPRVEFGTARPLVVTDGRQEFGPEIHFTSFTR